VTKLPLMESEDKAITKLLKPLLKEDFFVKTAVRVDRLYSKLKTEGALSPEELNMKHPFHPDIDVLYWSKKYIGEPLIYASEVKYFRLKDDSVYPNIYTGLGEALMLLSFGVDYVSLWHLFDPEIPSETVSRYRDLTQSLVTDTFSPINYQSWLLPDIPKISSGHEPNSNAGMTLLQKTTEKIMRIFFTSSVQYNLKTNPLRYRENAKIMRSLIKKAYRMVNK
jgi:hypothetical protein